MPELPEVHTTVQGLNQKLKGKKIIDVWSGYNSPFYQDKRDIKNVHYFKNFRRAVSGAKFLKAERRGKNILIHLSNGHTALIHMKMTGHLLYGRYNFEKFGGNDAKNSGKNTTGFWRATDDGPLQNPRNQYIRLVFSLSDKKHLVFSDLRKFAKIFVFPTKELALLPDIVGLGPEPMEKSFTYKKLKERLARWPNRPIKQILMDQSVIAGIGNIYSDEMLWASGVHPVSAASKIPEKNLKLLFKEMKFVLARGIRFGGDSESDYRNIDGESGKFQNKHHVYRHTGETCSRRACGGTITRMKVGGRSAHFCPKHQKLFGKIGGENRQAIENRTRWTKP